MNLEKILIDLKKKVNRREAENNPSELKIYFMPNIIDDKTNNERTAYLKKIKDNSADITKISGIVPSELKDYESETPISTAKIEYGFKIKHLAMVVMAGTERFDLKWEFNKLDEIIDAVIDLGLTKELRTIVYSQELQVLKGKQFWVYQDNTSQPPRLIGMSKNYAA